MILRLDPTIPLETPLGKARAFVLIDYSEEDWLYFVCFIDETRECRTFRNDQIRLQTNETMRPKQEAK